MVFFEDFNISKDSKIGITGLLSNITTREGSHKGGWARLLKCQLKNMGYDSVKILDNKDSILEYGIIIFDLGAEFSGALNMFGGLDEKVFKRLKEIKDFTGDLYSWRNELPSLLTLSGRKSNASSCEEFKQTPETFLQETQNVLNKTKVFRHAYKTNKVLIGDSHTPSVWTPEYMIERQDGRTLHGMLKKIELNGILDSLLQYIHIDDILIHVSSIDIRHHLMRQPKPEISTVELAQTLMAVLNDLRMMAGFKNVTVVHTMGIEDESRELPKTGYYKGTAFYGSWEERNRIRNIYNAMLDEVSVHFGFNILKFPDYFFDKTGKLKFDFMEKPQSIHTSPEFYRWDLDNNRDRWIHEEGR